MSTNMSNTVKISGASDDCLEFDGYISEEYYIGSSYAEATLIAPNGDGVRVTGVYTDGGTWAIGLAPLEEDTQIPEWNIRFVPSTSRENAYTAVIALDVPDGTVVAQTKSNSGNR